MKLKKSVISILIALLIININLIFAGEHQQNEIDKSYSCLEKELGDNCGNTKSTKQTAFNLLASAYDSNIQKACKLSLNEKKQGVCWGETDDGQCNIKSTALAVLALNHIGENVDEQIKWLLENRISDTKLTWFLEIDTNNKTDCTINGKAITIESNKKISGSPPVGLTKAYDDYWFQINDISKNYSISCNKDFITALIYQKPGSNVFHISSDTKSSSEFDTIIEKVNSFCLSTSKECDYEGSLWTAIALAKESKEVTPLIPYLTSMSDEAENKKFIPSAFLYILTSSDDYYSELISLQKNNNYWDESRNKFYDTALALLSLQNVNSDEVENSKKYLLSVRKNDGCWQSDTAFILHAAWPKNPDATGLGAGLSYCEDFGNFCVPIGGCDLANTLDNFYCPSSAQICCKTKKQEPTCSKKNGIICELNQECQGDSVIASDSNDCCIGDCIEIVTTNECTDFGFYCKDVCSESQEEKPYSSACGLGEFCCGPKPAQKSNFLLIILLIILIILIILAIIFRNQLRIWIFRMKSGFKSSKQPPPPPRPTTPLQPFQRMIQRPAGRPFFGPPQRKPAKDTEFEETMKKLKEMSK